MSGMSDTVSALSGPRNESPKLTAESTITLHGSPSSSSPMSPTLTTGPPRLKSQRPSPCQAEILAVLNESISSMDMQVLETDPVSPAETTRPEPATTTVATTQIGSAWTTRL